MRFDAITKRFPGVVALDDVSFDIAAATCHGLCGENGAGKSTLGKILAGIHAPDAGRLLIHGREARFGSPRDALAAGVGMVHQELAFCDNLSVAENLCLGALPRRAGLLQRREMERRADALLAEIGTSLDVRRPLGELAIAQQQLVQIAAAVGGGARIVVFDEPTSSLSQGEADRLYELVGRLKDRGVTCVFVSHRMAELFHLCSAVTVLRDGRHVATRPASRLSEAELVELMVGRPLREYFPQHVASTAGDELLRVDRLEVPGKFEPVSFSLRRGEVLGLAGLVGAGRSEIACALFGLEHDVRGDVYVDGRPVRIGSPREAIRLGIGLVPEDRKRQGLVLSASGRQNISLPILRRLSRLQWISRTEERTLARSFFELLRIRGASVDAAVAGLSGGTQQKVVLAKWLAARSRILILDEPTRGIDVGAKAEIHALIDRLAAQGSAILLISSELPELINLSTRILVLREGRLVGTLTRENASQDALLRLMAGLPVDAHRRSRKQ